MRRIARSRLCFRFSLGERDVLFLGDGVSGHFGLHEEGVMLYQGLSGSLGSLGILGDRVVFFTVDAEEVVPLVTLQ